MRSPICVLLSFLATSNAVSQGFNYGATKSDGSTIRVQSDFQTLFHNAKNLPGTSGFTSARLFTTVQGATASDPTSAIPAAIAEHTTLLLGLWASAGQSLINNEITALKAAIANYGKSFTDLVVGISVGSEDLYRNSPLGIASKSGYGADPNTIAEYIKQVRSALAGTILSSTPIGHVDTWTAWVNGSNQVVIDSCDWIGMDAYPYFQNTQANSIDNGAILFNEALGYTKNAVNSKPIWITETGWPVSGSKSGAAETGTTNAKTYWDQVGCPNFGNVNTWWFTLDDTDIAIPDPSFGIASGVNPRFDLSCSKASSAVISNSSSISSMSTEIPVVSSGTPISPTVQNGFSNSSNSGAAPNALSGTSSLITGSIEPSASNVASSWTEPSASNFASNTTPYPPINAAPTLSGSVLGILGMLLASFLL